MTRQSGRIGHDDMVAEITVMRHMGEGHQQAVLADHRLTRGRSAFVDRRRLAHCGAVADIAVGGLTFVFQVLWNGRNNSARKDLAVLADAGTVHNGGVGANPSATTNLHVFANPCESLDLHVICDAGIGMDIG